MLYQVYLMIRTIIGEDAYELFDWMNGLTELMCFVFAILMIVLTYKLWKYLLFGWWK